MYMYLKPINYRLSIGYRYRNMNRDNMAKTTYYPRPIFCGYRNARLDGVCTFKPLQEVVIYRISSLSHRTHLKCTLITTLNQHVVAVWPKETFLSRGPVSLFCSIRRKASKSRPLMVFLVYGCVINQY